MTVDEAKVKCNSLPECKGFTFKGPPTDKKVQIFFKRRWKFTASQNGTSTSYKRDNVRERVELIEDIGLYNVLDDEDCFPMAYASLPENKIPSVARLIHCDEVSIAQNAEEPTSP